MVVGFSIPENYSDVDMSKVLGPDGKLDSLKLIEEMNKAGEMVYKERITLQKIATSYVWYP